MKDFNEWLMDRKDESQVPNDPITLKVMVVATLLDNLRTNIQFCIDREVLDPDWGKRLMDDVVRIQQAMR